MKQKLIITIILTMLLTACGSSTPKINVLTQKLKNEFPDAKINMITTKEEDPNNILGDKGMYTTKIQVLDENDDDIIFIETFDNEKDMDYRVNYLNLAFDKSYKTLFIDEVDYFGGIDNLEFISLVIGKYDKKINFDTIGNVLIRTYEDTDSIYLEKLNEWFSPSDFPFPNKNAERNNDLEADLENKVNNSIDGFFEIVNETYDTIKEDENFQKYIKELDDLEGQEFVDHYNTIMTAFWIDTTPRMKELYNEDTTFDGLRISYENALVQIELDKKTAAEREEQKRKDEEIRKAEELKRKEEQEKQAQLDKKVKAEEYSEELRLIYEKNFAPDSSFRFMVDHDNKLISIYQSFESQDLIDAVTFNIVKGMFKEEMDYFISNMESNLKTQNIINPTGYKIHFNILNPANNDNVIYTNYDGVVILNLFNQ